jgi:hypothetical protein
MPIRIDPDYLSVDAREIELAIPVDARRRDLGVVRITVRELPFAKHRGLEALYLSALKRAGYESDVWERIQSGDGITAEEAERLASACRELLEANAEILRWGVVDHCADDFLRTDGTPIPFEAVSLRHGSRDYRCASPHTLRLYQVAGGGMAGSEGTLIPSIVGAVFAWQRGVALDAEAEFARKGPAKAREGESHGDARTAA